MGERAHWGRFAFLGIGETLVGRGDKHIAITFIGKKYNIGESGTITL